ncbi:MAG: hypothetical protein CR991_00635 [Proteobacteria bacterium]|nr:MAG: hypothetical protein CR991_00635 [Pseudomonadota bacterium]
MVITGLAAKHFRKYESLRLASLPEHGLIMVVGGRESGKSTIGDAICFALFGRTADLENEQLAKLVRWGSMEALVELTFRQGKQSYRIQRKINTQGVQQASLWQIGSQGDTVLANSITAVNEQIKHIIGLSYTAFSRAFFWSQLSVQADAVDQDSLDTMTGIKTYLALGKRLETERLMAEANLQTAQASIGKLETERDSLSFEPEQLSSLETINQVLQERRRAARALQVDIKQSSQAYPTWYETWQGYSQYSLWANRLALWSAVLLTPILLLWALLFFAPTWAQPLWPLDAALLPDSDAVLWLATSLAVLAGSALAFDYYVEQRYLIPLKERVALFASGLRDSLLQLRSTVETFFDSQTQAYLHSRALTANSGSTKLAAVSEYLPEQVRDYAISSTDAQPAFAALSSGLKAYAVRMDAYMDAIDADINHKKHVKSQHDALQAEIRQQAWVIANSEHQAKVLGKSIYLLHLAAQASMRTFNQQLGQRCQSWLSEFTQQPLDNWQIDQDFAAQVLSHEKGGFLESKSSSKQTQQQIILTLRANLANILIDHLRTEEQCLFMDEPFACFDTERTLATLHSLSKISHGHLRQIWLVVRSIPASLSATVLIRPQIGENRLLWKPNDSAKRADYLKGMDLIGKSA